MGRFRSCPRTKEECKGTPRGGHLPKISSFPCPESFQLLSDDLSSFSIVNEINDLESDTNPLFSTGTISVKFTLNLTASLSTRKSMLTRIPLSLLGTCSSSIPFSSRVTSFEMSLIGIVMVS